MKKEKRLELTPARALEAATELDRVQQAAAGMCDEKWNAAMVAAARYLRTFARKRTEQKRKAQTIRRWEQQELPYATTIKPAGLLDWSEP